MKWRDPYDQVANEEIGRACATVNNGPKITQESFAQDADINVLVRRFGIEKIQELHPIDPDRFGDFSGAPDLRTALEVMREAEDRFMSLPARLRARFDNSAAELWEFLQDDSNRPEAEFLGLVEKRGPEISEAVSRDAPGEAGEAPKGPDDA